MMTSPDGRLPGRKSAASKEDPDSETEASNWLWRELLRPRMFSSKRDNELNITTRTVKARWTQ